MKKITLLGALLAGALLVRQVDAQEAQGTAELQDVVVTARRLTERLQDVPVAVTVINEVQLKARGIEKIEDLNNAVPGLSILGVNTPTTLDLVIRGLGNTNPTTGSDAAVGFYIDEVPINLQNGTNLNFFDIDDVQVLKGPQGTLFGRNTTGGAVLVTTKKPVDYFEGYAQAGGTFFQVGEGAQFEGMVNVPVNDWLAVRAAITAEDRDGWVRNVIDRDAGPAVFDAVPFPQGATHFNNQAGVNSVDWRISAKLKLNDNLESLFVYSGDYDETTALAPNATAVNPTGFIALYAPLLGVPNPITAYNQLQNTKSNYFWSTEIPDNDPLYLNVTSLSNNTAWTFGDLTLKNIAGYRWVSERFTQDIIGLPGAYFVYQVNDGGRAVSDELQLQGKSANGLVQWVGGLFFYDENRHYDTLSQYDFDAAGNQLAYNTHSTSESAFSQATAKLPWVEGLSLTVGGRYTWDQRSATDSRVQPTPAGDVCVFPGLTLAQCLLRGSEDFHSPSYTVSLDYKWDADSLVYVANRLGYRSGGFSDNPSGAQTFTPFNPEHVRDYEVGLKRDWHFGKSALRTNFAIYHSDYKDIQRLVVDPTDVQVQLIVNAGRAKVNGGEAELTFEPFARLELIYGFAYTDPKYTQFLADNKNFAGETFAYAPHDTHNFSIGYSLPLDARYGSLSVHGTYHYETKHFYDDEQQTTAYGPANTLYSPGYSMVNMTANWKSVLESPVDIELFVRNLTDAKVIPNGAPLYYALGLGVSYFAVPPRMFGFNVRYNFGGKP